MHCAAWDGHLPPSDTERTTAAADKRWLFFSDDDLTDIRAYAVVLGNLWFKAASVIDAVDVCIKVAYVLGLAYPSF